jgi:hypothetical protein
MLKNFNLVKVDLQYRNQIGDYILLVVSFKQKLPPKKQIRIVGLNY